MTAEVLSNLFAGCKIPTKEMEKMITEFAEQYHEEQLKGIDKFLSTWRNSLEKNKKLIDEYLITRK